MEKRRPLSVWDIARGVREACGYRAAVGYTLATGLIFGPFVGYLSSAQQIYQTTYDKGPLFPAYFAVVALGFGVASLVNARLVMRFGMRYLSSRALMAAAVLSWIFLAPTLWSGGIPQFWAFMAWIIMVFFCVGIMFGNYNALSMEPLGHMAGLGAALIGAISTLLALPVGWLTGKLFDGGITPLVLGFALAFSSALLVVRWTERG